MTPLDEVLDSFWGGEDYGVQAPLNAEAVKNAEQLLGVRLPSLLLDLLRKQNGGPVAERWNAFPTSRPTSWSADHVPFDELMGIGEDSLSLLDTPYLVGEWGLPSPVVLLSGDGHWWIALDYRERGREGEPSVVWLDADLATELTLADDLRTFLEGLVPASSFDGGEAASMG